MNIVLNGDPADTTAETVAALVSTHGWERSGVAVALDGAVVTRDAWPTTALTDGCRVDVVRAMQGG